MITSICNIYINDELTFDLFKLNFVKVKDISNNWLIYIRGKMSKSAIDFLRNQNLGDNSYIFNNLNDENWYLSTKIMLQKSMYDYIYCFVEDHFLLSDLSKFKGILIDAVQNKIDYFSYSFFNSDLEFQILEEKKYSKLSENFVILDITTENLSELKKINPDLYLFSLPSVSKKVIFETILNYECIKSYTFNRYINSILFRIGIRSPINRKIFAKINKYFRRFNFKISVFSTKTPFNIEKHFSEFDLSLFPYKYAVLNSELFANFDDDNGSKCGSVIKRGLFPSNFICKDVINLKVDIQSHKYNFIQEGQILTSQFFEKDSRQKNIYIKQYYIKSGEIKICFNENYFSIKEGEHLSVYANKRHQIIATTTTEFYSIIVPNHKLTPGLNY